MISREIARLEKRLSGIRNMRGLPTVLFVIDVMREDTAVHEANLKNIPVVAMVDTNCDPKGVDHIIPSNDDAIRAIKLIVGKIADAVMEGKAIRGKDIEEEDLRAEPMPVGLSRYVDSDEELEDADLLGESTLKYLDLSKTTKDSELTEEPGDELEDEVFEELELTPEDEQPFDAEPDEPAETGELEEGEDVLEASEEDAIADDAEEN